MHGIVGSWPVHGCLSCGSGTTLPLASEEDLEAFYPIDYAPFARPAGPMDTAMSLMQRARDRSFPLSTLARGNRPGTLLDVGCGRGDLAASWIRAGWAVRGIEPSPVAASIARRRGTNVLEGTMATVTLPQESVDAVVFRHSLEHVVDPQADLLKASRALRPGGRLAIIVPNWASWQRRVFGEYWFPLELPRHRTHFTSQGLRAALTAAGFQAIDIRAATPFITTTWSLQLRLFERVLSDGGIALLAGYAASAPVSLVLRPLDSLLGGGDFLHAAAQRPPI
ncbi:MAG: class I SAM-dependent methyltransferase [Solirubrobacteraceae bacterium]